MASHISGRGSPSGCLVLLPLVWAAPGSLEQGQLSASLVLPHPAGDMIRDQTTVLSCWELLPSCPLGSPLLQRALSPVWQAARAFSSPHPCRAKGRGQMAGAAVQQAPPSAPDSLSLSPVVRNPRTHYTESGTMD